MKKFSRLGVAVLAASGAMGAHANGTFQALSSESVGVEAATTGAKTANIGGDSIVLAPGFGYASDDYLTITLDNGATFQDSTYTLEESAAGAGTGDLTHFSLIGESPVGQSTIVFKVGTSGATVGEDYILSGSSVSGQAVTFKLPALAAASKIKMDAVTDDGNRDFDLFTAVELFRYANEFSAKLDTSADGIVDVNEARLEFTTGVSDRIAIDFTEETITNGVTLTDGDKVKVVLSGNMAGIDAIVAKTGSITRGSATINLAAGTASFDFSASDLSGSTSAILDVTVDEKTPIATRAFTIQADLDFETETDKNLVAAATVAGSWTINGLQAKVALLSLDAPGFVSWLKVANTGTTGVEVFADIIYTLADGTEGSVESALLGSVDAGGVGTVGEAAILAALGNPTQLVDAHLTVTVTGPNDAVHLIAEKKASDGRLSVPVYYDNGSTRSWFQ